MERNRTPQQLWISGLHNSRELDPDDPAIAGLNVRLMTIISINYFIILYLFIPCSGELGQFWSRLGRPDTIG